MLWSVDDRLTSDAAIVARLIAKLSGTAVRAA